MADETGAARVDLGRRAIGFAAKIERNSGNGFNQAGKEGTILESPETKPRKEPPRLVLAVAAGDFAPRDAPADAGHSHCFGAIGSPAGCAARPRRIQSASAATTRPAATGNSAVSPDAAPYQLATSAERRTASNQPCVGRTCDRPGNPSHPATPSFDRHPNLARQRQLGGPVLCRP